METAVEWFFELLPPKVKPHYKKQLKQALVMEKEQIIDAFEMGQINVYENHDIDSDDYYQLNFKSE